MSSLKKSKKRQVVSSKLAVKPKKSAKKTKTKNTEPEVTFKAGKPVEATADINCLACMNWTKCPSKKKGRKHACTRLKLYPIKSSSVAAKKVNVNLGALDKDAGLNKEERVISAMISRTLKGSGVIAADTRIDDGDIPTCPNFFTWLTEPRYMGTLQVPWAKQLEHPTKLLSEWCPNPKCTDTKWWDNVPVDATPGDIQERVTFLEHGFCPICKTRKSEWIKQGLLNPYNALAGLAGQRSAKTATAVMIVGYNLHRLLKSQNPSTMYGVMSSQMLTATFAALTFDQAKDNIWSSVYNMLTDATWFQNYHELLRDQCHRLGIEDVHSITNTYARYRHRNLLYHVSGPNKRTMRGKCIRGNSIINTNLGFLRLDELVKDDGQVKVPAFLIDSHKGPREVSHTYKTQVQQTIRVCTKNGIEIEGTPEHPLLVITPDLRYVWRRLDSMQPGDFIVSTTAKNKPMFGELTTTLEVATILGYMVANGHRTSLSSSDPKVINRFKKCAESLRLEVSKHDGKIPNWNLTRGNEETAASVLRNWDYTATKASEKVIPPTIRMASKEVIHEFLEAYFECDSGINGRDGTKYGADIDLISASKELIDQLQVLLLHIYGILGRQQTVVRDTNKGLTTYYILNLCGYDAKLFSGTFKRAKINKYKDRFKDVQPGHRSDRRNVPYVREYLWNVWENARAVDTDGKRLRRLVSEDGKLLLNSNRPACFSGVKLANGRAALHCPEFLIYEDDIDSWLPTLRAINSEAFRRVTNLLEMSAHYEEVASVEVISKEQYVYDVTVPNGHAFTANGLASHNTRVEAMIDEIGWFLQQLKGKAGSDPERLDAKGTHEALDRSLLTVRAAAERLLLTGINENVPMGYLYETSSPSSKNDMIMQRYESSRGSRTIYGYRMATWEANPTIPRHSSIIVEAYRDDPITAQRDYAAIPPVSGSPFVKLPSLKNLFSNKRENGGMLKTVRVTNHAGQAQTSGRIKKLRAHRGEPSLLALDAGSVNNSFAFAVLYTNPNNGRVIVPFLGEVFPSHEAPIHFPDIIDNVVDRLIEHYNVQVLMADRWQSALLLQEAGEKHEIGAFTRSVKYPDFDMFRQSGIYDGVLQLPMLENKPKDAIKMANAGSGYPGVFANQPISHLLYQLVAVNDIPNVSVTKPDGGTDDLFRALALGYSSIMDPEYAEFFMEQPGGIKQAVGTMVGGLGFGGSANVSNSIGVAVGPGSGGGGSMASMGVVAGRS